MLHITSIRYSNYKSFKRSDEEIEAEKKLLSPGNKFVHIHSRKEVENSLLISEAIEKAIRIRITDISRRTKRKVRFDEDIKEVTLKVSSEYKNRTQAQLQAHQLKFQKSINPKKDEATIIESILQEFENLWNNLETQLAIIPGKDFLSSLNTYLQSNYKISISQANIIGAVDKGMIQKELLQLMEEIDCFRIEKTIN